MCRKGYHLRDQGMQPVQRFVSRCAGAKSPKSRPQPGKGSPDRGEHNQAFCNQHLQSAAHLPYHFSHKRGK